jgi:hypothetical protein
MPHGPIPDKHAIKFSPGFRRWLERCPTNEEIARDVANALRRASNPPSKRRGSGVKVVDVTAERLGWLYEPPESCPCGDDDPEGCMHFNAGYVYCACGAHHRLPVAKTGACPVDVQAETAELVDQIESKTGMIITPHQRSALRDAIATRLPQRT